jgi:hypothetical protein
MRDLADHRQFGHVLRQRPEDRQEGHQGHDRVDKGHAEPLHDRGEAHGVFLHTLRGALDVADARPALHVEIVHRRAPAEDVVADKKAGDDEDSGRDERDLDENQDQAVEICLLTPIRPRSVPAGTGRKTGGASC